MRDEFDNVGAEFHSTKPRFLTDKDVFYICVILGLLAYLWISPAHADWRAETSVGNCRHGLAEDASWHYSGYPTNMSLTSRCFQIGMLWEKPKEHYGLRIAYVDLGAVNAYNAYPLDEHAYFVAKETHTAVQSPTSSFQGVGTNRGITFGPVIGGDVCAFNLSGEIGVAALYNTWHAWAPPYADHWDYADGWNATWYAGLGARWKYFTVSARRYANVHASQADKNYQYIGPTSGAVIQTTIGVSIPL